MITWYITLVRSTWYILLPGGQHIKVCAKSRSNASSEIVQSRGHVDVSRHAQVKFTFPRTQEGKLMDMKSHGGQFMQRLWENLILSSAAVWQDTSLTLEDSDVVVECSDLHSKQCFNTALGSPENRLNN
uniref:Nephrin n=1 Tax=Steinernema glaseri TaxID=37863 RepID=A0A1I7Z2F9_9BILA